MVTLAVLVWAAPAVSIIVAVAVAVAAALITSFAHQAPEVCVWRARLHGPRGDVSDGTALQARSALWRGAHTSAHGPSGLAARVRCGMGAIGERALLARVRRDELGE